MGVVRDSSETAAEIEALYRARSSAFLYSATAFLRDGEAALDVVQEAFAVALRRSGSFRGEASLETWLWRIMLNLARDRQRSLQRLPFGETSGLADEGTARDGTTEDLRASLLMLPERQRLAVFLRYYADLSYTQIAEALGVKPGTVAASLHAAHAALRQQMEGVAG
jgi:RNA polymerase sigma-70 factor (ECF subfamily)